MSTVAKFVTLIILSSYGSLLHAQKIGIQLINGKHGRPLASSHVNVWVGRDRKAALVIPTDATGTAWLNLTEQDKEVTVDSSVDEKPGGNVFISPTVRYRDFLGINVPYVLCVPATPPYSWLRLREFSTKEVVEHGFVGPNSCGKSTAAREPRKIVLFVRPLTFWESLRD